MSAVEDGVVGEGVGLGGGVVPLGGGVVEGGGAVPPLVCAGVAGIAKTVVVPVCPIGCAGVAVIVPEGVLVPSTVEGVVAVVIGVVVACPEPA